MMNKVIDIHAHLGDCINLKGGDLINKQVLVKQGKFDPISMSEAVLHRKFGLGKMPHRLFKWLIAKAERDRSATATKENMKTSMEDAGVSHSVCLPIYPYLRFADLEEPAKKDESIIPFTGVDFSKSDDDFSSLSEDVNNGAKGLKLHPILQKIPLTDPRIFNAVEAFSVQQLPVLFHCGVSYYNSKNERSKEIPDYGSIDYGQKLAQAFPNVTFIAGHAGMFEVEEVMAKLAAIENVFVDTSFQSPETVRDLINKFGSHRVMYASDWPFGNRKPAMKIVKKACNGDEKLERKLFFENASEILKML